MEHVNNTLHHCDFCGVVKTGLIRCESCGASATNIPRPAERIADVSLPAHTGYTGNTIHTPGFRESATTTVRLRHKPVAPSVLILMLLFAALVYAKVYSPGAMKQTRLAGVSSEQSTVLMIPNHHGWYLPHGVDNHHAH